jgi:hypothetical protein
MRFSILFLAFTASLAAQGVRFDSQATTTSGSTVPGATTPLLAVPGASIAICGDVACQTSYTTYTDATLATACAASTPIVLTGTTTCTAQADYQGNFGFWTATGNFWYIITLPNGTTYGPYAVTNENNAEYVSYTSSLPNSVKTTSQQQFAKEYSLLDAGCVADSTASHVGTDNGPCITQALQNALANNIALTCPDIDNSDHFFGVQTPVVLHLSGPPFPALRWLGNGKCWIVWNGSASSTTSMIWIYGNLQASADSINGLIAGIHFSTVSAIQSLLQLDGLAFLNVNDNVFDTVPNAYTTPNPPNPQLYLLLRAAQITRFNKNSFAPGASVAVRGTGLIAPVTNYVSGGCSGLSASVDSYNNCYVTIMTGSSIPNTTSASVFNITDCKGINRYGTGFSGRIWVDPVTNANGQMLGGEVLRGTITAYPGGGAYSGTGACIFTVYSSSAGSAACVQPIDIQNNVQANWVGLSPCRGDEYSVAATHAAGAHIYFGEWVTAESVFTDNLPWNAGNQTLNIGSQVMWDSGYITLNSNKIDGAPADESGYYMAYFLDGSNVTMDGQSFFEGGNDDVTGAVYMNGNSALFINKGAQFDDPVNIQGGQIQAEGVVFTGLTIGNYIYNPSSYIRFSNINYDTNRPLSPALSAFKFDTTGSFPNDGSGRTYSPSILNQPLYVGTVNAANSQTTNSGPMIQFGGTVYDGTASGGGGHIASVIQGTTTGAPPLGGIAAIQFGNGYIVGDSSSNSDVSFCSTVNCASGTATVASTNTLTITTSPTPVYAIGAGPYSWVGALVWVTDSTGALSQHSIQTVSSCSDTTDTTECTVFTINGTVANGSATWTTKGFSFNGGNVTTNTPFFYIPNLKSASGTRYICINTSGQLISSASACSGT